MVRKAKFGDIPRLAELLEQGARRSKYSDRCSFDMKETKSLLVNAIQRHGLASAGGSCVFVSEHAGAVDGVIVGVLDRVYHIFDKLSAGDLAFYVTPGGSPRSAGALIDAYFEWADGIDAVIETLLGATDIVQDYEIAAALYQRKGMVQTGVIYERRLDI